MRILGLLTSSIALLVAPSDSLPEAPSGLSHRTEPQTAAQAQQARSEIEVTLAYRAELDHPYAGALLVRRSGQGGETILVVTDRTSNLDLARALMTVARSMKEHGAVVTRELRAYIPSSGKEVGALAHEAEALQGVKASVQRSLDDLGSLPTLKVTLDSQGMLRWNR